MAGIVWLIGRVFAGLSLLEDLVFLISTSRSSLHVRWLCLQQASPVRAWGHLSIPSDNNGHSIFNAGAKVSIGNRPLLLAQHMDQ